MGQAPPPFLTLEDFLARYGDDPGCELIDGELRDLSPPAPHTSVAGQVAGEHQLTRRLRPQSRKICLGIAEDWLVDFCGLGGVELIGRPKQLSLTVCQLAGPDDEKRVYRLGEAIASHPFTDLPLRLEDLMPEAVRSQRLAEQVLKSYQAQLSHSAHV